MRNINPGGGSISIHENKISTLTDFYPERMLRFGFDNPSLTTIDLVPEDNGSNEVSRIRFAFEVGDKAYQVRLSSNWTLSKAVTTINLDTNVGGIVDGIAAEAARDYLFWGFLDDAFNFAGIGLTRKPYSVYTAGTAAKGASASFTVTNAFQYTNGARVVIRNADGTAPLFEYNWGTITDIPNNTTLTITTDNSPNYGTALTGTTSGVIKQWNKFRPWVVTSSGQTLYQPYYSLLGELTLSFASNINIYFKANDEWRPVNNAADGNQVVNQRTPSALAFISAARYIPLWSHEAILTIVSRTESPVPPTDTRVSDPFVNVNIVYTQVVMQNNETRSRYKLFGQALIRWSGTSADLGLLNQALNLIAVEDYRVLGGMRG